MGNIFSQFFPPSPTFTETSVSSLQGKVYIVTGASAGVGLQLARLLYLRNGTVYVATRNAAKAQEAIKWIKTEHPDSSGSLHFLKLDLNDLEGIKPSVEEFLSKEKRLDVLWNNAGMMYPPKGSVTKQGYETQFGTNCVAPFLFTKLLTPLLIQTAKASPAGDVRVVWVSSIAAEWVPNGGVHVKAIDKLVDDGDQQKVYGISKGGNVLQAHEYATRYGKDGVVSIALNPGNLRTELQRNFQWWFKAMLHPVLYPAVNGAYTELFAGLSPDVPKAPKGSWVLPWGRIAPLRKDLAEGGNGVEFWEWCEKEVERYA